MFGAKGTNGTSYTLSLSITSEIARASGSSEETEIAYPPAWTLPPDGDTTTLPTRSMQLEALLFDPNDVDITKDAQFTWSIEVPTIGLNSGYTQNTYLLNRAPSTNYNGSTPTMAH